MVKKNYNEIINDIIKKVKGNPKLRKILIKEFGKSLFKGKILISYSAKTKKVKGKTVHDINLNWSN